MFCTQPDFSPLNGGVRGTVTTFRPHMFLKRHSEYNLERGGAVLPKRTPFWNFIGRGNVTNLPAFLNTHMTDGADGHGLGTVVIGCPL